MEINTTRTPKGETSLRRLKVTGSSLHVNMSADWTTGKNYTKKHMRLTLNKEEAIDLVASILSVLGDATREAIMLERGLPGDSFLRFPSYNVFASDRQDKSLARNQPVFVQEDNSGDDVLLNIDGNIVATIDSAYPPMAPRRRSTWGLTRLQRWQ